MKQSRLMSLVESSINIAVGFGISVGAQALFLPMLGVNIPIAANLSFALIMTVISIARSFLLRRLFEALHIRHPLSPGALAIIAERRRQIDQEGWTATHDADHANGELALAGASYALHAAIISQSPPSRQPTLDDTDPIAPEFWPWTRAWWKPYGFRRDLVRAGALILAEIDRFDRNRRAKKDTRTTPIAPMQLAASENSLFARLVPVRSRAPALAHRKSHSEHAGSSA